MRPGVKIPVAQGHGMAAPTGEAPRLASLFVIHDRAEFLHVVCGFVEDLADDFNVESIVNQAAACRKRSVVRSVRPRSFFSLA